MILIELNLSPNDFFKNAIAWRAPSSVAQLIGVKPPIIIVYGIWEVWGV